MDALNADSPKKRGRKFAGGRKLGLMLRMEPTTFAQIDAWIAEQPEPKPSRPKAIRRLMAQALKGQER